MAKIMKTGNVVPMASLGRFVAGISGVVIGAFMVAGWAAGISTSSPALFAGLIGSWPVGIFGIGAIIAAGVGLGEGRGQHATEATIVQREVNGMVDPVMVNPQAAFIASRIK